MELKKYKKKRITPQGWKEVTLADAFNTSSGATPLSTEASYYENGNFNSADDVHNAIISNFNKLFEITIYAINPKNPEETLW